jgi:hypothetical protein
MPRVPVTVRYAAQNHTVSDVLVFVENRPGGQRGLVPACLALPSPVLLDAVRARVPAARTRDRPADAILQRRAVGHGEHESP